MAIECSAQENTSESKGRTKDMIKNKKKEYNIMHRLS